MTATTTTAPALAVGDTVTKFYAAKVWTITAFAPKGRAKIACGSEKMTVPVECLKAAA